MQVDLLLYALAKFLADNDRKILSNIIQQLRSATRCQCMGKLADASASPRQVLVPLSEEAAARSAQAPWRLALRERLEAQGQIQIASLRYPLFVR